MVLCPEGHESEATDYCDTCGSPISAVPLRAAQPAVGPVVPGATEGSGEAEAASPGEPGSALDLGPPEAAPSQTCPHCGALNVADALFCESCGYDFTTGAAPLGEEPSPEEQAPDEAEAAGTSLGARDEDEAPEQPEPTPGADEVDEPEQPEPAPGEDEDDAEPDPEPEQPEPTPGDDVAGAAPDPEHEPEPEVSVEVAAHARPRHTPPSRDLADTWVVEVWVDPDWYAVQQTAEACPSAGVPDVVAVQRSVVLIGRPSGSLGSRPEVDAGADSAVSRRHAQLTSDGRRWWIEDLGSSNGTYVGTVGEPLPTTPLTPGQRVEIDRDDRIYVGAWTRLVLRQATESEREGTG
ncbi:FHA domain-containing protein [Serinicoccus sp. CNJ-927]|uniref:FHA domain-containing protein n=1 Tax=Serinicoccus sp. CNJ-927 TaxID=1904970 RepID=UPI0009FA762D|nr:FHA domain-containing protein [Serinicoccus sp. CNJ-927]